MIQTDRLTITEFSLADAAFIVALLTSETWLYYIGDKNVRSIADGESYLRDGPMKSYRENGYGPWKVTLTDTAQDVGMCGLVQRENFDHPDIGFALLPQFEGNGYAIEAAKATMDYAYMVLKLAQVVAITDTDNVSSQKLLKKLGLRHTKSLQMRAKGDALMYFE